MNYIAYIHKDHDSDFGVSFRDFPGCVTAGRTLREALRMAKEALVLHIKGMIEDGERIPRPTLFDDATEVLKDVKGIPVIISVDPKETETVRVNFTARRSQVEEIDRRAKQAGLNRSAYIVRTATASDE